MTTDITELALIAKIKKQTKNFDTVVLKEGEAIALEKALEKAQTINAAAERLVRCKGRHHSEQNYRALAALFGVNTPDLPPLDNENVHYADAAEMEIAALRQRIAELESFRTAYMEWSDKTDWVNTDRRFGVVKPLGKHRADVLKAFIEHLEGRIAELGESHAQVIQARDHYKRMTEKGLKQLAESRTVTDWIEHDGKWRPDSLSTDELVYLKTRKQELKIPYPAGKVMGWMHTGGDMDVMAYKLASPQARTVTVKLPELCVGVVQGGHAVMVPYAAGHWFNKTAILEMLAAGGIKVEAE